MVGEDKSTELWRHPIEVCLSDSGQTSTYPGLVVMGGDSCSIGYGFKS